MPLVESSYTITSHDSSVVRASASGAVSCGSLPRMCNTKGNRNGTGCPLADACNKRVVPGRYKKAGKYLLGIIVMSQLKLYRAYVLCFKRDFN